MLRIPDYAVCSYAYCCGTNAFACDETALVANGLKAFAFVESSVGGAPPKSYGRVWIRKHMAGSGQKPRRAMCGQ